MKQELIVLAQVDFYLILLAGLIAAIVLASGLDRKGPEFWGSLLTATSVYLISHLIAALFVFTMHLLGVSLA